MWWDALSVVHGLTSLLLDAFTTRESSYVCEAVAETGLLVSMDMVEVNPLLATRAEADATIDLGVDLIRSSLGQNILS